MSENIINTLPTKTLNIYIKDTICDIQECGFKLSSNTILIYHYRRYHPKDSLTCIDRQMHQCGKCGLYLKISIPMDKHHQTSTCLSLGGRKYKLLQNSQMRLSQTVTFYIQGTPIEKVPTFKYLVIMVDVTNDYCPEIQLNLQKAQTVWSRIRKFLIHKEVLSRKTAANYYKVIIMSLILYGDNTW